MRYLLIILMLSFPTLTFSQPNCNFYKIDSTENDPCYQACLLATEAEGGQGSRKSQGLFDKAIELCPSLDYAYYEKSVPYLKRGDLITWKKLIDKAVALNPTGRLGYRGWCRYQFVKDYKGAIQDIEKLDSLVKYDIGYSQNGDYHLNIVKALCYKAIGQKEKAISIIENQLQQDNYSPLPYDFLHLGVLKMEMGYTDEALKDLQKSIQLNSYLADSYYYLGLIYKKAGQYKSFKENMEKAKALYLKGYKRLDSYTEPLDKVYLADIQAELNG
ncbi:tetratricopeptide repeat protein [Pontibacter ummariensis]|uniref:Tetratricopeptide repeat-containing protein n=1 Tax=Pontibacter ummariensis TaxID=1610492 RepID=A0A239KLV4_9BACT|nr:hypothetical protein [Pontibacter ummariensis]PRY05332.1 tetratricopeptide repeat protein [Pontibacter ummariensis]SNT19377.1 Tetratricopeptide repeat-containing protein [Pontibacter ummariensis]